MPEANKEREGPEMEDEVMDAPTVTITDEAGRSLICYVEHSLDLEGQEYLLLLPVDSPIEIFVWQAGEEDEEEAVLVEQDAEIDLLFPIASAVLQEQNLKLKRTAVALTVEGELPDVEEEDYEDEEDGFEEHEELQFLANFYHEEQEYAIYTPLDPFFILARLNEAGQPVLLTPEEMEKIEPLLPMIEDQLFDEME
ncbi:MAG: DUF3727 domain-containing protein [Leptolyngbyaceae cyanobacterium bins.59]|nr:DUF3727 domain-containing protein [Leptolyngbyaceae cyanobacterium bins.59]